MIRIRVDSEEKMSALGMSLAKHLQPGDVLLLFGELGAGKTVLTRGIARGLGVAEPVTSPTFTLLHSYAGAIALNHFDLYRLSGAQALFEAGLLDYIGGDAVSVVEWPERCIAELPACHLKISIQYMETEGWREVIISPQGGFREMILQ